MWLVGIALCDVFLIFYVQNKIGIPIKYRLISILFIIGYLIVFYQRYVDLIIGNISADSKLFISSRIIIKCCLISTIGLAAFGFGYLSLTKKSRKPGITKNEVNDLNGFRILFFISTIVFFVFNTRKIVSGSYSQANLEAEAGTMVLYSDILYVISFVILIAHILKNNIRNDSVSFIQYNTQFGWTSVVCLIMYCFANTLIGDRGPLIICLSVYFGAYFLISKSTLRKSTLLLGVVIASLFLSLIGQLRVKSQSDKYQNIDVILNDTYNNNSILPFSEELSGSVKTLHYSVYYVPDMLPYSYGLFPMRYVASAIPFGDRLFYSIWPLPRKYTSSAFFITWLAQGDFYTYGNGTSCNADLYLSFGLTGVLFGLWLWGLFIRFLEYKVFSGELSINLIIVYLLTCGYSIYVNRAYFLCYLNYIVFAIVLNFIYHKIILNKSK